MRSLSLLYLMCTYVQAFAVKILSQRAVACGCERNWSTQKYCASGAENLLPKNLDRRVFCLANIRLEKKLASPHFCCDVGFEDPEESEGEVDPELWEII